MYIKVYIYSERVKEMKTETFYLFTYHHKYLNYMYISGFFDHWIFCFCLYFLYVTHHQKLYVFYASIKALPYIKHHKRYFGLTADKMFGYNYFIVKSFTLCVHTYTIPAYRSTNYIGRVNNKKKIPEFWFNS